MSDKTDSNQTSSETMPEMDSQMEVDFFSLVTTPPDWLNQDYFERALQSYENDKTLKVNSCDSMIITITFVAEHMTAI